MGEADPESAFLRAVDECLEEVEEAGGVPPLLVAAVAVNGAWVSLLGLPEAQTPGLEEQLVQYLEADGLAFPVNVLVTDARGNAVLFHVEANGKPQRLN